MRKYKTILNIQIFDTTLDSLLIEMKSGMLVTPNVDHLIKLQSDKLFYDIYRATNWVICDSKIISLALRFLGTPIQQVIPGSSFFPAFCQFHKNSEDIHIFLLGASVGVAKKAMDNINRNIGRNIIVGAHSPSFGFENDENECKNIINIINNSCATVLVVGVGAPKQEKWIHLYREHFKNITLFMPLGATIDFEAGKIKRAPVWLQNIGMEWLYRLLCEPKRLWRRYLINDIPFFYLILKQKFKRYKNPFD